MALLDVSKTVTLVLNRDGCHNVCEGWTDDLKTYTQILQSLDI
jgi:hypothetical protein